MTTRGLDASRCRVGAGGSERLAVARFCEPDAEEEAARELDLDRQSADAAGEAHDGLVLRGHLGLEQLEARRLWMDPPVDAEPLLDLFGPRRLKEPVRVVDAQVVADLLTGQEGLHRL